MTFATNTGRTGGWLDFAVSTPRCKVRATANAARMTKRKRPQRGMRDLFSRTPFTRLVSWTSVAAPFPESIRTPILILSVLLDPRASRRAFSVAISLLRFLVDPVQDANAGVQIGRGNVVEQFMTKLECRRVDLRDHPLSPPRQMNGFATAIVRR